MAKKNPHVGSSFESWLEDAGIREEATAAAIKAVIARQLASEMKKKKITKQRMAELMKTSRAQVDRLLDPDNGSATIESLQRAISPHHPNAISSQPIAFTVTRSPAPTMTVVVSASTTAGPSKEWPGSRESSAKTGTSRHAPKNACRVVRRAQAAADGAGRSSWPRRDTAPTAATRALTNTTS